MQIVIDGIIYQLQSVGGISRIFSEVLPRICELDDSFSAVLLMDGAPRQKLPFHPSIARRVIPQAERFLRPGRMFRSFVPTARAIVCNLAAGKTSGKIWHSTYYTRPAWWNGPEVLTVPDMIHEYFPDLFGKEGLDFPKRKRDLLLAADAVIAISQTTRNDLQRFYGIEDKKIWVIPLACSEIFTQPCPPAPSELSAISKPFLLYVGVRVHYKNFHTLLQAYSRWHSRGDVDLLVAGRRWSKAEEEMLATLGIDSQVHLLENVDDSGLAGLYRAAMALVYPSLYEGFGIPLLEAMASGCPIVASRIPSTVEVAGDYPIYFDSTQVDDLVAALDRVLQQGRASLAYRQGSQRIGDFSWEKTARQTLEVYRALYR